MDMKWVLLSTFMFFLLLRIHFARGNMLMMMMVGKFLRGAVNFKLGPNLLSLNFEPSPWTTDLVFTRKSKTFNPKQKSSISMDLCVQCSHKAEETT